MGELLKKGLYAVAVERWAPRLNAWRPEEIVYVHGVDVANARFEYLRTNPDKGTRIVALGPVIGYHVEDSHGEILSV